MKNHLLFLGTGTSTGVPQVGCDCPVCRSLDPADKRLRASALLTIGHKNILIDCGPDLRTQLLKAHSPWVDAVLVTHSHYDHVGGLIDLRPYALGSEALPIYCMPNAAHEIRQFFPYCFVDKLYPGVPQFELREVKAGVPFQVCGIEVLPLLVMHYKMKIAGYRIGDFAYVTDCKTMPDETLQALQGVRTLVINALRIEPHMSHISLSEAIEIANKIGPERTYFTHMSHHIGFVADVDAKLPHNMQLARDMMTIEF